MALHHETAIYSAVVELGKFVITAVRQMPRDVKLLLGGTLRDEVLWMGVLVLRMNKARDAAKVPHIDEILEHVELVTMTLRFCRELRFIAPNIFAQSLPLTVSIGKQASGLRNRFAPPQ